MSSPSREAILASASRLFGDRGYRSVTVRDIASDAGVSAALVMKLFGSKEKLFAAAQPNERLLGELNVPREELGAAMVFRVLMRREREMQEPWAMLPFTIQDSPDPVATRAETQARYLGNIAALIGDTTPNRHHAAVVVSLMIGFGESVRTLGLFDDWDFDEVVAHYGALVQAQIDAFAAP
ncbi:TetR/AcrR family transcriptional regulator [Arthrobacter sp. CJ23]|uniref:TetR/AcrR family transcriptional regulator n=1 Tax=Arthrobacter sp. CJ23 TaxID=2972479 RepID=UPI00215BBB02|nr:TetR/AcrR family transcriptional regulator [Arthrobacter sp. CJ23]UVJ39323.1 TetR family transcriptional regulator [Arthrobacter sp. CJ23]